MIEDEPELVWVLYDLPYNGTADETHRAEREFRYSILGPKHWSGISYGSESISISLHLKEEEATLFKIKYANAIVDANLEQAYTKRRKAKGQQ